MPRRIDMSGSRGSTRRSMYGGAQTRLEERRSRATASSRRTLDDLCPAATTLPSTGPGPVEKRARGARTQNPDVLDVVATGEHRADHAQRLGAAVGQVPA